MYFDSFGVEYNPRETKKFIGKKSNTTNIYRIQVNSFKNVWILSY